MTTTLKPDLIIIDDDPINNMICMKMLRHIVSDGIIEVFTQASKGIDHIARTYTVSGKEVVLFLDIDMPVLSGWETLQQLTLLPQELKQKMKVFILTSSADPIDKLTAANEPLVSAFITKPLSFAKLKEIFPENVVKNS